MPIPLPLQRGSLVAAAIVAAAVLWLALRGGDAVDAGDEDAAAAVGELSLAAPVEPGAPTLALPSNAAAERVRELQGLSETFRNTTFLIAIRDSGYVCNELLDVYGGFNNSHTWTATCADMLAYTVSVADDGGLAVDPMLQHLDGVPRRPLDERPPRMLPPAPLTPR
jgi:hypothetical protein